MNTGVPAAPTVFDTFEQYIDSFHENHEQILKQQCLLNASTGNCFTSK